MRADAGGVMGDPNGGLSLTKKGSLAVMNNGGGGNDSWSVQEIFKLSRNRLLLVGRRDLDYNIQSNLSTIVDVDFITGKRIDTAKNGVSTKTKNSHVRVKPLVRFSELDDLF